MVNDPIEAHQGHYNVGVFKVESFQLELLDEQTLYDVVGENLVTLYHPFDVHRLVLPQHAIQETHCLQLVAPVHPHLITVLNI